MQDGNFLETLRTSIRNRDSAVIVGMFFESNPPKLKNGLFREDAYWDFKAGCPSMRKENGLAWAEIAASVLGFHNADGGVIFLGMDDTRYSFCGTSTPIDAKQFNSKIQDS